MPCAQQKIVDLVSASELLKALNTLQNMSVEHADGDVSFNQDCRQSQNKKSSKTMDFDVYMANKSKVQRNRRKSVSPQRISRSARPSPILTNLKSKSHSPLHHTPTKTERVRQQKSFKMFLPSEKQFVQRRGKENKKIDNRYNDLKNQPKKFSSYRASYQSRKILDEKEKKGNAYIPIQQRTKQLLKNKQLKIAKLQKQQEIFLLLAEKECTFRPTILRNWRKQKQQANLTTVAAEQEKDLKQIMEESLRFQSCSQNEFICMPQNPRILDKPSKLNNKPQHGKQNTLPQPPLEQVHKKYKNKKFNVLLDMIH